MGQARIDEHGRVVLPSDLRARIASGGWDVTAAEAEDGTLVLRLTPPTSKWAAYSNDWLVEDPMFDASAEDLNSGRVQEVAPAELLPSMSPLEALTLGRSHVKVRLTDTCRTQWSTAGISHADRVRIVRLALALNKDPLHPSIVLADVAVSELTPAFRSPAGGQWHVVWARDSSGAAVLLGLIEVRS